MFGHLKAKDFTNLVEGGELPSSRRSHLQACAQCTDALVSAQSLHAEISKLAIEEMEEQAIPEPDWFQFRSDVRTAMLSRAAQRQPKASSWSGWLLRPAMTWGLAVAFTAGLTAGLMIWNHQSSNIESVVLPDVEQVASLDANDSGIADDASLEWSQTSVFDELSQLNDAQSEKLQRLLEADAQTAPSIQ